MDKVNPPTEKAAMLDAIDQHRAVLEEIAYGNDWGGPDRDHIAYMRGIAVDLLENGSIKSVI